MKTGYIAIIGEPNVGKSTLFNRLIGTKLSVVSKKPQTTRNRILGILTENGYQCCFLDTPGIISPEYPLQESMVSQIRTAVEDSDILIWMTDPWFKQKNFPKNLIKQARRKQIIAVINKVDLIQKSALLPVIEQIKELGIKDIIPTSAIKGDGISVLKETIFRVLPEGPFLYPEEDLSDSPERFFVAEIIREKIFEHFKEEIPYSTCVIIEEYKEREQGKDFIRAAIYVEKDSQKGIIIGKKGAALKRIGATARREIENLTGHSVYLDLWVKVKEKWRKDKKFLKEIGY